MPEHADKMNKPKHILVVCQYFYPEQFRINDICLELVKRGYRVSVITGIPNYPQGKFYPTYGCFRRRRETWQGIDIHRIFLIPRGKSSFRLALNYLSFPFFAWFWKCFTRLQADAVFIYQTSPLMQAYPGVWFAQKRHLPCVMYVLDLWPDSFTAVTGYKGSRLLAILHRMSRSIYRRCGYILTSSRSNRDILASRELAPEKLRYWPQYAEDFYRATEASPEALALIPQDRINLLFAGNIGYAQGLEVLPACAALLKEQGLSLRFNIIGAGRYREEMLQDISERAVGDYFNMIDKQAAERMPGFYAACDAALICLADKGLFASALPAKIQSSMACALPLLVSGNGEVQKVVQEAGCGFVAAAGDAQALAEAIKEFMALPQQERTRMGAAAQAYSTEHFDKDRLITELTQWLGFCPESEQKAEQNPVQKPKYDRD